jgi:hypothetical protein
MPQHPFFVYYLFVFIVLFVFVRHNLTASRKSVDRWSLFYLPTFDSCESGLLQGMKQRRYDAPLLGDIRSCGAIPWPCFGIPQQQKTRLMAGVFFALTCCCLAIDLRAVFFEVVPKSLHVIRQILGISLKPINYGVAIRLEP